MSRKITDTTKHSRVIVLVDKLQGYPRDPDFRGQACPPAPFGRTLTEAEPIRDPAQAHPGEGQQDNRPLVYLVRDEVAQKINGSEVLTASERVELQSIVQLGEVTPEDTEAEAARAK